jgi:hypothetical protein
MKKNSFLLLAFMAIVSLMVLSCTKDLLNTDTKNNDLSQEIKNIVPDTTLQKIINLGMPINKGTSPTNLENIYKVSPLTLKSTTVPNDYAIGSKFSDYKFRLYEQDNSKLTIKFDYVSGSETGTGLGAYISGSGKQFTVFVKVHSLRNNSPAEVLHIISGTITSDGISDFYFSNYMLEDYGDPQNVWMGEGQGRVFYDSDNISPVVSSLQAISMSGILEAKNISGR